MKLRERLIPYLLLGVLTLGVGLGVGLGVSGAHVKPAPLTTLQRRCAGMCGGFELPAVSFKVALEGKSIKNDPEAPINGGTTAFLTIRVSVPKGVSVSSLEIGTGVSGRPPELSGPEWGIGRGGPLGVDQMLAEPHSLLRSGRHTFEVTWPVPPSASVTGLNVFYLYTPPFNPAGNAVTQTVATFDVQAEDPTLPVEASTITVVPATDLRNRQTVQVVVSGFPPGKVFLSECASAEDANELGCGSQLAEQPFAEIQNGAGNVEVQVTDEAATTPLDTKSTMPCTTSCVIVATNGVPSSGFRVDLTAPITFSP